MADEGLLTPDPSGAQPAVPVYAPDAALAPPPAAAPPEGLLGRTPADSKAAALQQIEQLRSDPAFELVYQDRHHPGQAAAAKQLDELYTIAFPGDHDLTPVTIEAVGVDPETRPAEGESEDEVAARVELERVGAQLQAAHGANWQQQVDGARQMLRSAVGDENFETIVAEAGNDTALISELVSLAELDASGMLGVIAGEYLSRNVYGDRAALEIETLRADPEWQKNFEGIGRQHDIAVARDIALRVLANPPAAIVRALQGSQR